MHANTQPNSDAPEQLVSEFWYRVYPELRYIKSRTELREIKNAFRKRGLRRHRSWIIVLVGAAAAAWLSFQVARLLNSWGVPPWGATAINGALWLAVGALVSLFVWHRPYVRFVRQYLQNHGIAVCLKCGYDLRAQTEPRCPECGNEFDPKLLTGSDQR